MKGVFPMAKTPQIASITKIDPHETSIRIPVTLYIKEKPIFLRALIDSGAEGVFINSQIINRYEIPQQPLSNPITIKNVDGTTNKEKEISRYIRPIMKIGDKTEPTKFWVTSIGQEDIILGLPWLQKNNPQINWADNIIRINQLLKKERKLEIPEYCRKYYKIFNKKAAERFPPEQPYDHAINLKSDFEIKDCPVYSLTPKEMDALDDFLEENLRKGFIRPSKSPIASPFFFVPKKDPDDLRPCQDYRALNAGTVPDRGPLPIITDLLDRLSEMKYFTKLDL